MYPYRCTEQQLPDALQHIEESGDALLHAVYKGGRDWVLICRKADTTGSPPLYGDQIRKQTEALVQINADLKGLRESIDEATLREAFPSPNLGDARRSR